MSARLEDLLDQTRDALLAGNLTGLADLAGRVETLAQALSGLDRQTANRLQRKAERNASLLQAALRGIRAARQRVAEIGAAASLTTYDAKGRREVLGGSTGLLPKRV